MKYIKYKMQNDELKLLLFPRVISHKDFHDNVAMGIKTEPHGRWFREYREPLSAGLVNDCSDCFGKSGSLNLKVDKVGRTDDVLLDQQLLEYPPTKYVTFSSKDGEFMIVFPNSINHDELASQLILLSYKTELSTSTPISAGFIGSGWTCHGRSETLDLNSREEQDTLLLQSQLQEVK